MSDIRAVKLYTRCNRCMRRAEGDEYVGLPCGRYQEPGEMKVAGYCQGRIAVAGYPDNHVGWCSWYAQQVVVPGD